MAKKAYVGVSNVARNCNKIYVGVNDVARKVVKGYVGVDGVARQFWGGNAVPSIYSYLYPHANVYDACTLATNNGTRTPVTKEDIGDAVCFGVKNGAGDMYFGGWLFVISIALQSDPAKVYAPNMGAGSGRVTVNGIDYYVGFQATNAQYGGGATDMVSPIDIPMFSDIFVCNPNGGYITSEKLEEFIELLDIRVS